MLTHTAFPESVRAELCTQDEKSTPTLLRSLSTADESKKLLRRGRHSFGNPQIQEVASHAEQFA
jgi:hypothetical protein